MNQQKIINVLNQYDNKELNPLEARNLLREIKISTGDEFFADLIFDCENIDKKEYHGGVNVLYLRTKS